MIVIKAYGFITWISTSFVFSLALIALGPRCLFLSVIFLTCVSSSVSSITLIRCFLCRPYSLKMLKDSYILHHVHTACDIPLYNLSELEDSTCMSALITPKTLCFTSKYDVHSLESTLNSPCRNLQHICDISLCKIFIC